MPNPVLARSLIIAFLALAAGCASDGGGYGNRTAVLIQNHTPKEIIDTAIAVFEAKEFTVKTSGKMEVVVEQKSSGWKDVTWGGWSGDGVWERAHLRVMDYGAGAYLLEADVRMISDKGDEFFEDSQRITRRAHKPYQELLNEVQRRLAALPTAGGLP
ncbi:MAG TPA: hypothetical protein VLD18_15330 [Verrucomicrobiae bacterium]|nr:hypothetical protein [Verrucomicrobiae bacterium]